MTFEKRVYVHEFKLNDTDDSVIEFIKLNRSNIHNLSIHNIADALYISPNAIMRTAKKLGYSGFSELKFSLQKDVNLNDTKTVENNILEKLPRNIIKTLDVIDDQSLDNLINVMINANKILFVGMGESVFFCELFAKYFRCLDRTVESYAQIHDLEYAANHCKKGDLILILSSSGSTPRLINIAKKAKEREIDVYCITHFGKNSISEICDGQVCYWGEKRIVNGYNVADRSGLMMLIRIISEDCWKKICK